MSDAPKLDQTGWWRCAETEKEARDYADAIVAHADIDAPADYGFLMTPMPCTRAVSIPIARPAHIRE